VAKDESIAAKLYAKAAEQGHPLAEEIILSMPTTSQPEMPACLLPDPPAPLASSQTPGTMQAEQQGETAAVFYSNGPILRLVNKLAPRYQIDPNLAMAFIAVESGFDTQAVSPKNAQGLMQLIPETAIRFRVKNAYNAEDNIKGGLAYLQWLLAFFKGNVQLVAAAYNAGERTVEKYKGVPPYPETQNYVQRIAALYKKSSHPFRDDLVKASPFLAFLDEFK
jgi:soluble lytic murein transglycosylase-like protein